MAISNCNMPIIKTNSGCCWINTGRNRLRKFMVLAVSCNDYTEYNAICFQRLSFWKEVYKIGHIPKGKKKNGESLIHNTLIVTQTYTHSAMQNTKSLNLVEDW